MRERTVGEGRENREKKVERIELKSEGRTRTRKRKRIEISLIEKRKGGRSKRG